MEKAHAQILLVEDDEFAVELFEMAARKVDLEVPIVSAGDGEEALEILREGSDKLVPHLPVVVVLDINMPRMDGHEFLNELRQDQNLKDTR